MKAKSSLLLLIFLVSVFVVSLSAKSINVTSGFVKIGGGATPNSVGQPNEVFSEFNLQGDSFSFVTASYPSHSVTGYFSTFFPWALDGGQRFSLADLNYPFQGWSYQFAQVSYRGAFYSRIIHNQQNMLNFDLTNNTLKISRTAPYTASTRFTMNGNILLKCHPSAVPQCNSRIQTVKAFGKGTLTVSLSRWEPSDEQWAWLNVKSLRFDFEE
jgi:hypothetical protein